MAYNGVLSSGKMNADQIITTTSLYDFREDNKDSQSRGSRRNGSRSGQTGATRKARGAMANIFNGSFTENTFSPAPLAEKGTSEFDNYFLDD